MSPVKGQAQVDARKRVERLLQLLSPWDDRALTYERFAKLVGVTEDAVKTWMRRGEVSKEGAAAIADSLERMGWSATTDWILRGKGPEPRKGVVSPPSASRGERSAAEAGTGLSGGGVVAEGSVDAHYGRRAGNTPGTVASGGEESIPGSPALEAIRKEAQMAVTVLQRAIRRALEKDEYTHTREGRDLVIQELVQFSERLGLIGLGDIGLEISTLAHRMRETSPRGGELNGA